MQLPWDRNYLATRHWRVTGWLLAAVWLFFLNIPLLAALHQPEPWRRVVGAATLVAFGVCYVFVFQWARGRRLAHAGIPLGRAWAAVALLLGLGLAGIPGTGGDWLTTLVFVAAAGVFLLPSRQALVVVALAALTPPVTAALVPGWEAEGTVVFAVLLASFAMFGVTRLTQRNSELQAAQQEIRRLAVAEERARTARDLHDILGHSLTVVAVKAELAGRLLERDPIRAATEIADVERLARQALAGQADSPVRRGAAGDVAGAAGGAGRTLRLDGTGGSDQRGPAQRGPALRDPGGARPGRGPRRRAGPGRGSRPGRTRAGRAAGADPAAGRHRHRRSAPDRSGLSAPARPAAAGMTGARRRVGQA
ncbi:sensor histidine kinase [Micromonospora globispora]|uniref:sensor histidine kinase n=1 Tax=Micromonospora globispora TaxID=1450148 RepID=UPI000F50C099|nr:histidine kinase [Micromonospora globispora]